MALVELTESEMRSLETLRELAELSRRDALAWTRGVLLELARLRESGKAPKPEQLSLPDW